MSRKMKNLSAKILLDFLALFAMSAAYLVGKAFSGRPKGRDGMI